MATWKYLPPPIGVQQGKEDERKPAQKTQWKYLPPPIGVETKPIEQKKTPAKTISTLARKETALAPRIPIAQPSARRTAQPGQGYFGVPAGTSIATAIPRHQDPAAIQAQPIEELMKMVKRPSAQPILPKDTSLITPELIEERIEQAKELQKYPVLWQKFVTGLQKATDTPAGQLVMRGSKVGASRLTGQPTQVKPAQTFGEHAIDMLASIGAMTVPLPGIGVSQFGIAKAPAGIARTITGAGVGNVIPWAPAAMSGGARLGALNIMEQLKSQEKLTPKQRMDWFGGSVLVGMIMEPAFEAVAVKAIGATRKVVNAAERAKLQAQGYKQFEDTLPGFKDATKGAEGLKGTGIWVKETADAAPKVVIEHPNEGNMAARNIVRGWLNAIGERGSMMPDPATQLPGGIAQTGLTVVPGAPPVTPPSADVIGAIQPVMPPPAQPIHALAPQAPAVVAGVPEVVKATAKEPWEMTQAEYRVSQEQTFKFEEDETIPASDILPPHEVRDIDNKNKIKAAMKESGWTGRPILVAEGPNGTQAITGSHRIAVAKELEVDVPVVRIDQEALESFLTEKEIDLDRFIRDRDEINKWLPQIDQNAAELFKAEMEIEDAQYAHKGGVRKALSQGKPVPPEVLKDYPDLKAEPTGTKDILKGIPVAPKGYLPGLEDVSREKVAIPKVKPKPKRPAPDLPEGAATKLKPYVEKPAKEMVSQAGTEQPLIKRGQRSVNFNRGGTVQSQSRGGTFVGEHFVAPDISTIAYAQTDKTYGVYDKTGNQIKGGFDKASKAIEYAKALYPLAPSETKVTAEPTPPPVEKPAEVVKGKEPWEMSKEEWETAVKARAVHKGLPETADVSELFHTQFVKGRHNIEVIDSKSSGYLGSNIYTLRISSPRTPSVKDGSYYNDWDKEKKYPTAMAYDSAVVDAELNIIDKRYKSYEDAFPSDRVPSKTSIFRGVSSAEFGETMARGYIESRGSLNLSHQKGETLYARNPSEAASYAGGFAPWYAQPSFEQPGYIIQVKRPPQAIDNRVGEVVVTGKLPTSDIEKVYELRVSFEVPGEIELKTDRKATDKEILREGSRIGLGQTYAVREVPKEEWGDTFHKRQVKEAHAAGKPVPESVLKDYPDLKPKAKEAPKVAAPAPAVPVAKEPFNEVNHAKSVLATAQIGGQNIIGRKNFVEALKTLQKNGLIPKNVDVKGLSAERAEMWVQQVEHQTFEKTLKQKGFADLDEAQLAFDAKNTPFDKWQDDNAWSLQGVKSPQEYYKKLAEKVAALSPAEQKELKMNLQLFGDNEREKLRRQMFAIANKHRLSREQRLEIARGIALNPELASTTELTNAQMKKAIAFMTQYGTKMSPARKKLVSETQVQQLFTDAETEVKEAEFKINRSRELGYEVAMASDVYKVLGTTPPEGFMDVPIGHYWGGTKMFIPRDLDIKDISAKDIRMLEKQPNIFDYIRPFYRTLPQPLVDEVTTGRRQADRFANDYSKILDDMTKGLNEKQRVEVAAMLEGIVPQEGKMGEVARAVKDKFFDPLFEKAVSAGVLDQEQYVSNYFSRISDKMKKVTGETFRTPERWFTKGRIGKLFEYKKDVREVGFIYIRALSKAMYIDPVQKKWEPVISKMPSRRKGLATEFLTIAAGRPGTEEALVNQFVTDMFRAIGKDVEGRHAQDVSRALTSIIVQKLMGMNPGSMLKNYTQQILPAADVAGKGADRLRGFKYLVDSKRMLATKAGQDFVKQYCILLDQRVYHEGLQKISHLENKLDKLLDKSSKITMFGFQAADINNVKTAFLIGYQAAIKDGKSVTDAIAYANDVALRTQFPYDIRRAPVYNGPLGRLIGLFSSYPQHFVELTSDWAISDHKLRALIAMAGLFGVVSLFRRLGLVVRVNVWDTIQGHLLWKTAKGEPGAFKSSIDDFNKFAGKLMSGDYESWLEAVEDAYYVLGPGSTQLKRIDKIKQAAKDGWRVRNAKGRVMYRFEIGDTMLDKKIYEMTGIPGEAWRSLFGQTVESEERWKEKQEPSIFEKLGSKVKEKTGGR